MSTQTTYCNPRSESSFILLQFFILIKRFCLRDRGRLGNEGRPISLKIGTQSTYVDLCNMPKFQLQRLFLAEFWISAPQGSPEADFSVQFWPLLNLFFSNMKLISGKNKTIFVKPYPWAFMGENISSWKFFANLWLLSQLGHI